MGANNTGSLSTSISGLPFAFSAQVIVTGPNNYRYTQNIPGGYTETLTGLAPGMYFLQPQPVCYPMLPRNMYSAAQQNYNVIITAQNTTTQTIPYSDQPPANTGGLAISVSGLFSTAGIFPSAKVKVTGPNGYYSALNISPEKAETLTNLTPGTYTLQPQPVPMIPTRDTFFPAQETYTLTVTPQNIATQNISYNLFNTFGTVLGVSISGLPPNLSAQVKITGSYSFSSTLTIVGGSNQSVAVPPGTYILQAQPAGSPSTGLFPAWFPDQMNYTITTVGTPAKITITYSYHT